MDKIANMLTKIRNAIKIGKKEVSVEKSKIVFAILEILKKESLIAGFSEEDGEYIVDLSYEDGDPVITDLKRVSKLGRRVYVNHSHIKPVMGGRGVGIISTSQGLMTALDARSKKLGGEYICQIW